MTEETLFAVIAGGVVENVIVADQEFINSLEGAIADPNHDTGLLTEEHQFVELIGLDARPGVGWTYDGGEFAAPPVAEPTLTELEVQAAAFAAAEQRADDDAFLEGLRAKARRGVSLTQDERDRMTLLSLLR